jgi:quinol monooxygenase YgiN
MYTVRTEFAVLPGGNREFEKLLQELGELRKAASGGLGQTLLRSYGRPNMYTLMGRYENAGAHWRFSNGSAFTKFVKSVPEGLAVPGRPQEAYFGALEVDADTPPSKADCEVLVDWDVPLPQAEAFEEGRRGLFEVRKQHQKGFATNRLRRNAGIPNRYLAILISRDYQAAIAANGPEAIDYIRAHPLQPGATNLGAEVYHVVHRIQ